MRGNGVSAAERTGTVANSQKAPRVSRPATRCGSHRVVVRKARRAFVMTRELCSLEPRSLLRRGSARPSPLSFPNDSRCSSFDPPLPHASPTDCGAHSVALLAPRALLSRGPLDTLASARHRTARLTLKFQNATSPGYAITTATKRAASAQHTASQAMRAGCSLFVSDASKAWRFSPSASERGYARRRGQRRV